MTFYKINNDRFRKFIKNWFRSRWKNLKKFILSQTVNVQSREVLAVNCEIAISRANFQPFSDRMKQLCDGFEREIAHFSPDSLLGRLAIGRPWKGGHPPSMDWGSPPFHGRGTIGRPWKGGSPPFHGSGTIGRPWKAGHPPSMEGLL